ncbi:MAG TPA: Ig-like domain-containing protein [Candidatus Limnocylindrales bacterium]|nr:Ig-like domain-containing protein [Candidatus Limnocylindrales bacterium]
MVDRSAARHLAVALLASVLLLATLLAGATTVFAAGNCAVSTAPGGAYTATLCITAPAGGATVSGEQTITATLSVTGPTPPASGGKLQFYLDGTYLLTDYQSPYAFVLPTTRWADGSHALSVEAVLRDGYLTPTRATIGMTFSNGITTPPPNTNTRGPVPATAPGAGQPYVVAVTGDGAGGELTAGAVTDTIAGWNPNLLLYVGDVYEKGTSTEFRNWYGSASTFYGRFRTITNPAIGNHEQAAGGIAPGYFDYWDNLPRYYSYDVGNWHLVSIDSTSEFGEVDPPSAQYQWLLNDLTTSTKACTIVYMHHPPFTTGASDATSARLQDVWRLLPAHGVDLLLTGHDHSYQRWTPMDLNGVPNAAGTTEIVVGTGGHGIGAFIKSDTRMLKGYDTSPISYGALRLELNPSGAAWRFVNKDGSILDSGSRACSGAPADTTAPTAPSNLAVGGSSATKIDLTWTASTDDVGVASYDVFRDGVKIGTAAEPKFSDATVSVGATYAYTVKALDAAGHSSAASNTASVTTPSAVFADGFETGDLSRWNVGATLVAEQADVFNGSWGASAVTTATSDPAKFAAKTLSPAMPDIYYRTWFKLNSHGSNSTDILRFRTAGNIALLSVSVTATDRLNVRNDTTSASETDTSRTVTPGNWHSLQAHVTINGANSTVEVWLDGARVTAVTQTQSLGTAAVGIVQLGEPQASRVYDLTLDDAAVAAAFIPTADAPIPAPASVSGVATPGRIDVSWSSVSSPSLTGYELYRNGSPLAVLGTVTTYSDHAVVPGIAYTYAVRALAADGSASAFRTATPVTAAADTVAPTVSLTGPSANAILSGTISLSASASDNGAVDHVDFIVNGQEVGDSDVDPFSLSFDTTTLPEGPATFAAMAVDLAGNSTTTAARTAIIDNKLPDTTILTGPSGVVTDASASFSFSSDEPGSTFLCSLDGGAFAACPSPKTYSGLADGAHTFAVQARDAAGNVDQSPAGAAWTIDTSNSALVSDGFETGLGLWTTQGTGFTTQTAHALEGDFSARAVGTGTASWAYASIAPTRAELSYRTWFRIESQGPNNLTLVRFRTATGGALLGVFVSSTGKLGYTNDTLGTSTTSTQSVSGDAWHELQVHALVNGASGQVDVSLDGSPVSALSKVENLGSTSIGRVQLGESLAGRTFDVAFDEVLVKPQPIAATAMPYTVIDGGPSGRVSATSASFDFSSTAPGATFECALDGQQYAACQSPAQYSGLAEDVHTFQVRATDASNVVDPTPALRSWTIDTTAPTVTLESPADGSSGIALDTTVSATFSEPVTVSASTFVLTSSTAPGGVDATVSYDPATRTATLDPTASLEGNTTYTATLIGGGSGIADLAGNALAADHTWSFFTGAIDTQPPDAPTGLTATAISSGRIDLSWTAASDNVGVTAYRVYRDGAQIAALGNVTSYSDTTAGPSTGYSYEVTALDAAALESARSASASATALDATFADRFETGDLSRWTTNSGVVVDPDAFAGAFAARAGASGAASFATRTLAQPTTDLYYRTRFKILDGGANNVDLIALRTSTASGFVGRVFVTGAGNIEFVNGFTGATSTSTTTVSTGAWHDLQLHALVNGAVSTVDVWLDGARVAALSGTTDLGSTPIAKIQLGEHQARTFDVLFDDVVAAPAFINDGDTVAPATPANFSSTAVSPIRIDLSWDPVSDASGYNLYRNGALVASLGAVSQYSDAALVPATTYQYLLRARDATENASAPAATTMATPGDTGAPSAPTALAATAASSGQVDLSWTAAQDDVEVVGYDIYRDGVFLKTVGPVTAYSDASAGPSMTYSYRLLARDVGGNPSPFSDPAQATTKPVYALERFETGDLSRWATVSGLTVQKAIVDAGIYAARATSVAGPARVAVLDLGTARSDLWVRTRFQLVGTSNGATLLGLRTGAGGKILRATVSPTGRVAWTNDTSASTRSSTTPISTGAWHELQVHAQANGATGTVDLWLDGVRVADVSGSADIGSNPVQLIALGDDTAGHTYDVVFDDLVVADAYVNPGDVTPPATPSVTGTPLSISSVRLDWGTVASAAGFHVYRDGGVIATLPAATLTYTDTGLTASTAYAYEVRSFDAAENLSAPGATPVTTLADSTPPSVSLTAPAAGAKVSGTVSMTATASDNDAVTRVDFLVDGSVVGSDTSSPYSFDWSSTGHAAGNATLAARAYDAATNQGTSANVVVTVDNVAPNTSITTAPPTNTSSTSASIAFTSTESGSTFLCQLDFGTTVACTSPRALSGLADGVHTFQVAAKDAAGNVDATPASTTWTVDTVAPGVPSGDESPLDLSTNVPTDTNVIAGFNGALNPTTLTGTTFFLTLQGSTAHITATVTYDAATTRGILDPAAALQSNRTYVATIRGGSTGVKDPAGNAMAADRVWTFTTLADTTPPDTTITAKPTNPTTATSATFSFTATEPATFQCSVDSTKLRGCNSPKTFTGLTLGSHIFRVAATDTAGNVDPSLASYTWTIVAAADTTPPDTTITAGPSGFSAGSTTFSFSSNEANSTFRCQVDGAAAAACTSPKALSGLAAGSHTFSVVATDAAGNTDQTPATRTWTVDLAAPTATLTAPAAQATVTGMVTLTATAADTGGSGIASVTFYIDGNALATDTSSPYSTTWNTKKVSKGSHTISASATDAAGNAGQRMTITVTVN